MVLASNQIVLVKIKFKPLRIQLLVSIQLDLTAYQSDQTKFKASAGPFRAIFRQLASHTNQ